MTDATHATPGPLPPPPRRQHGCLYGCLIAAGIFIAIGIGGGSMLFYYMSHWIKDAPTVKAAIVQLDNDQAARALLGDNIEISGASSSHTYADLATGSKEAYEVHVKGTKGEGEFTIEAHTPKNGTLHFDKLSLSVGGQTLDVLHTTENPGAI